MRVLGVEPRPSVGCGADLPMRCQWYYDRQHCLHGLRTKPPWLRSTGLQNLSLAFFLCCVLTLLCFACSRVRSCWPWRYQTLTWILGACPGVGCPSTSPPLLSFPANILLPLLSHLELCPFPCPCHTSRGCLFLVCSGWKDALRQAFVNLHHTELKQSAAALNASSTQIS